MGPTARWFSEGMTMPRPTCETCKAFYALKECRRHAPVMVPVPQQNHAPGDGDAGDGRVSGDGEARRAAASTCRTTRRSCSDASTSNLLEKLSADRALASDALPAPAPAGVRADARRDDGPVACADEFVLIEAFRDAAKSTTREEACAGGLLREFPLLLLIGETYTKACQRLAAIDYEARTNVKLHHVFGGKVLARKSIENRVFFKSAR
jgi:hypothetical protein